MQRKGVGGNLQTYIDRYLHRYIHMDIHVYLDRDLPGTFAKAWERSYRGLPGTFVKLEEGTFPLKGLGSIHFFLHNSLNDRDFLSHLQKQGPFL